MKIKRIASAAVAAAGLSVLLTSAGFQSERSEHLLAAMKPESEIKDLPKRQNSAFREGEVLTYRLHYGMINAGVAILEVKPDLIDANGRKLYHMVGTGYTTGSTDWFFKVRDRYESYVDKDALLPWVFVRRVDEGGFKFSQDYTFNHFNRKVDVGNNEKYDVPAGVQDMVSAFYSARNLDLSNIKEGEVISIPCFVDKELWPMQIRFVGRETIKTDLGKVRCLKFRPIVQKGRVFKKEEDMSIWISDDKNHVPMRAEAEVLVGSIKMDISGAKNLLNPLNKVN